MKREKRGKDGGGRRENEGKGEKGKGEAGEGGRQVDGRRGTRRHKRARVRRELVIVICKTDTLRSDRVLGNEERLHAYLGLGS